MKESELRIGNFLRFPFTNETIEVLGVNAYDEYIDEELQHSISFRKDNSIYCERIHLLKPIELTEEWLIKFGFEFGMKFQDFVKGKYKFTELKNKILYGEFSEEGIFYFSTKTKIKYVHQLQNLYFALTGTELTINQ